MVNPAEDLGSYVTKVENHMNRLPCGIQRSIPAFPRCTLCRPDWPWTPWSCCLHFPGAGIPKSHSDQVWGSRLFCYKGSSVWGRVNKYNTVWHFTGILVLGFMGSHLNMNSPPPPLKNFIFNPEHIFSLEILFTKDYHTTFISLYDSHLLSWRRQGDSSTLWWEWNLDSYILCMILKEHV